MNYARWMGLLSACLSLVLIAGAGPVPASAAEVAGARASDQPSAASPDEAAAPVDAAARLRTALTEDEDAPAVGKHNGGPAVHATVKAPYRARAGGKGAFVVTIKRNSPQDDRPAQKVRNAKGYVTVPKGLKVRGGVSEGWRCKPQSHRRLACKPVGKQVVGPGVGELSFTILVSVSKRFTRRSARAKVTARWRQKETRGPSAGQWLRHRLRASGELQVDPALRLKVRSASGKKALLVAGGPRSQRTVQLAAKVAHSKTGSRVRGFWKQVAGPKVRFVKADGTLKKRWLAVSKVKGDVTQSVIVPKKLKKTKRLKFRFTASSGGTKVTRKVTVRVVPDRVGQFNPRRKQTVKRLLKAGAKPGATPTVGKAIPTSALDDFAVVGPKALAAGETTELSFSSSGRPAKVSWSYTVSCRFTESCPGYDVVLTQNDRKVKLTAPKAVAAGVDVILTATARMASGRTVTRSHWVAVSPAPGKSLATRAKRAAAAAATSAASNDAAVCDAVTAVQGAAAGGQVPVELGLGSTLTLVKDTATAAFPEYCASGSSTKPLATSAMSVTTGELATGMVGYAYAQELAATGGEQPYTWTLKYGSLPTGLALASNTGAISGTPTQAGTFQFSVQATDAAGASQVKGFEIVVETASSAVKVTTTALPDGTRTAPYSQQLTAAGGVGPYSWELAPGSALPPGLNLNATSGVISGTPTESGNFDFSVKVTDAAPTPVSDEKTLSVKIGNPTRIDFTGAKLSFAGVTLSNVAGSLSEAGIRFTAAKWDLPASWKQYAGANAGLPVDPTAVSVGLAAGKWEAPTGQAVVNTFTVNGNSVDGLAFLPLPGGFKFDKGGFQLEFTSKVEDVTPSASPSASPSEVAMLGVSESASAEAGRVGFSVGIVNGATDQIKVTASGIGTFTDANGGQLQASGTGVIDVDDGGGSVDLAVECVKGDESVPGCELARNLFLTSGSMSWSRDGLSLGMDMTVRSGKDGDLYGFAAEGSYTSTSQWGVKVATTTPWVLDKGGLTITELVGTVAMVPADSSDSTAGDGGEPASEETDPAAPGDPNAAVAATSNFEVDIKAAMTQEASADDKFKITEVSGQVTNMCSEDSLAASPPTCTAGEIRLYVTSSGIVTFNTKKGDATSDFAASGSMNLSTYAFTAEASLSKVDVFDPDLQIDYAGLSLAYTPAGVEPTGGSACQKKPSAAAPAPAPANMTGSWSVGIAARGTIKGQSLAFSGQLTGDGNYCIYGQAPELKFSSVSVTQALVAYTSYPDGATMTMPGDDDAAPLSVDGKVLMLAGKYILQDDVAGQFDDPQMSQELDLRAQFNSDLSGFSAQVAYTLNKPVYLVGTADTNNMTFNSATLCLTVKGASVDMAFTVGANYHTPVGVDPVANPASDTPLYGSISVKLAANPELTVGFGVGDMSHQPVPNAFGQPGLTVNTLAVAGTLAASPSFSFAGSVEFPQQWVESLSLKPGTVTSIGFNLSYTNTCVSFDLHGAQTSDPTTKYEMGFDLANLGVLQAREFMFVIAPTGCSLPAGAGGVETKIAPGFAVNFDGELLGAPVAVGFGLTVPGPGSTGMAVDANLELPKLALGPVTLGSADGTGPLKFAMKIDTAAKQYWMSLDAGLVMGVGSAGVRVAVKGDFTFDPGAKTVDVRFTGAGAMNFYIVKADVDVDFSLSVDQGKVGEFGVFANMYFKVLGQTMWANVGVFYDGEQLRVLGLSAGTKFNMLIGSFSGNFGIDYCRGNLALITADESQQAGLGGMQGWGPSKCNYVDANGAALTSPESFTVRLWGTLRLAWWKTDFYWKVVDKDQSGSAESDADLAPTTSLSLSKRGLQSGYDTAGRAGTDLYAIQMAGPSTSNGCQTASSTANWNPDANEENPQASTVSQPSPNGCSLDVYLSTQQPQNGKTDASNLARWGNVNKLQVNCWADVGCKYNDAVLNDANAGWSEAMTKLLSAPGDTKKEPGQIPTNWEIRSQKGTPDSVLVSPGGKCKMYVRSDGGLITNNDIYVECLNDKNDWKVKWRTSTASEDTTRQTATMREDGNFVLMDSVGKIWFQTGTAGNPGAYLQLDDDGSIAVYRKNGTLAWKATSGSTDGGGSAAGEPNLVGETGWIRNSGSQKCLNATNGSPALVLLDDCLKDPSLMWSLDPDGAPLITNGSDGGCLAIQGGDPANGTAILTEPCDDNAASQRWQLRASDHSIYNATANKCLDVSNGSSANGTKIQIWDCNQSNAQTWEHADPFTAFGEPTVFMAGNANLMKCLDGYKPEVYIWDCNHTPAQRWQITKVDGMSYGQVINQGSGRCLDAGDLTAGKQLTTDACSNSPNYDPGQLWKQKSPTTYASKSGLCIDVRGGVFSDGQPVQLWECNNTKAQNWTGYPIEAWKAFPASAILAPGERLNLGDRKRFRTASGMDMTLYMDPRSNKLNVYNEASPGVVVWSSDQYKNADHAIMQTDGNLVLYKSDGTTVWSSGQKGNRSHYMAFTNDGKLAMYPGWMSPNGDPAGLTSWVMDSDGKGGPCQVC